MAIDIYSLLRLSRALLQRIDGWVLGFDIASNITPYDFSCLYGCKMWNYEVSRLAERRLRRTSYFAIFNPRSGWKV